MISAVGLVVTTQQGVVNWPVDEIRQFVKPTWVVQKARGRQLTDRAVADGILTIKPYPEERLPILRQAVGSKKIRVLAANQAGAGAAYLQLGEDYSQTAGGN